MKGECLLCRSVNGRRKDFVSRDGESGCFAEDADDVCVMLAEVQMPCRGT